MKKGSVAVNEGEIVREVDFTGESGNSGMSERPYIHLQLIKNESENY